MVKKYNKYILVLLVMTSIFTFSGCSVINNIEKKLGIKNEYFEYLNSNNVRKVSIESTRDTGFKFIVTEESAIREIYNLLSKAKVSEVKSNLDPDYKFIFELDDEVKEFYYVVGSDEGNFYNDNNIFTVSKRLDEGIIKNLSFIRKPRDFEYIYYNTILGVLKKSIEKDNIKDLKVGIDINGDVDCLKYIFSNDLKNFLEEAKEIIPNVNLIDDTESDFDVVITVKNRGYNSTNFKTIITIHNKKESTEDKYYVKGVNEYKEWIIDISEPNELPEEW